METPTATAAVSSSPGDTVSAPCRGSRPGPAALDRLRQWWGPAPARPKPVWSTRRVEHGGQRREAAMGKGLPGGRRQAGSIDYRTEPRRSVLPDRPQRAAVRAACATFVTTTMVTWRAAFAPSIVLLLLSAGTAESMDNGLALTPQLGWSSWVTHVAAAGCAAAAAARTMCWPAIVPPMHRS